MNTDIGTKYIASLKSLESRNWELIEASMREVYAENVEFKDPLFHKHTLNALLALYKQMIKGARAINIILENEDVTPDGINIKLTLEYTSKIGLKVAIRHAQTFIKFKAEKVIYRQDKWGIKNLKISLFS